MANKPLQSIKFPDLPDTYTIPVVDSTLAVSGAAADAKETGDSLANKVDKVSGKGLSTEDYTTAEKSKLAGIETGATKTTIDSTLTVAGNAADAKAVGDAIANADKKALAAFATDIATGAVASFPDGADNVPMKDVVVHIEPVQEGSGDPSPDNVRPITGWTGAKVTRTGKNLYPIPIGTDMFIVNGGASYSNDNGKLIINTVSTNAASGVYLSPRAEFGRIIETYDAPLTVSMDIEASASGSVRTIFCGAQDLRTITNSKQRVSITAMEKNRLNFNIYGVNNGATLTISNLQIELGSTATEYEPYSGQTYDITFPSEAGTVYGGTLDVTKGELVVDRAIILISGITWSYYSVAQGSLFRSPTINNRIQYDSVNFICSAYKTVRASDRVNASISCGSDSRIDIIDNRYSSANEFKSAMGSETIVYPIATPITYTLTPQEITSLLGENNVWADTGDSDVQYRADTKLYIDNKIAELQALVLENNGGN